MGFGGYNWEGFKKGIRRRFLKTISMLFTTVVLLGGGRKVNDRIESLLTVADVSLGLGGYIKNRITLVLEATGTLSGGGGQTTKTESVLADTVILSLGVYP